MVSAAVTTPATRAARRVVVRAGLLWWVLALVCVLLDLFAVLVFGLEDASTVDRLASAAVTAAIASTVVATATERWVAHGQSLVGFAILQVLVVDAQQIADVDDRNGLAVVLRSGRRLELAICQPSLAQALIRNRRRRREAAAIRRWLAGVGASHDGSWSSSTWQTRVRWPALVGIVTWTALAPAVTLVLGSLH